MAEKLEFDLVFNIATGQFDKVFRDVEERAKKSGATVENSLVGGVKGFGKKITQGLTVAKVALGNFIAGLALGAVRSFGQALKDGASSALEFEQGIAEVNTLLSANQKVTKDTAQALRAFSIQFGTDQQRQVKAFYDIVSAGVSGAANQLSVLETANRAATAGLVDIKTSAFALVSATNAYSQSGLTAEQASDSLFQSVRDGIVTFGQLAGTIGNVTGFSSAAGVTFQETAGSLAFLTKSGISAELAATSLRQVFATLIKPAEQSKEAAKEMGIEFSRAGLIAAGGLVPFLKQIKEATNGSSEAIARLFPNIRATSGVLKIIQGDFQNFEAIINRNKNSVNATNEAFAEIANTGLFQLNRSISAVSAIFSTVFTSALDGVASKLDSFPNALVAFSVKALTVLSNFILPFEIKFQLLSRIITSPLDALKMLNAGFLNGLNNILTTVTTITNKLPEALRPQGFEEASVAIQGIMANLSEQLQAGQEPIELPLTQGINGTVEALRQLEAQLPTTEQVLDKLKSTLDSAGAKAIATSKDISKAVESAFVTGISRSVQAMTNSLILGQGGFEAFGKAVLGILGDMAIQMGQTLIGAGLGIEALKSLGGTAAIAAGIGLVALGTIIKSFAGGGASGGLAGASPPSVTGAAGPDLGNTINEVEDVDEGPRTIVNLTVQGDILDSQDTPRRLADLLNAGFDNEGLILKQAVG